MLMLPQVYHSKLFRQAQGRTAMDASLEGFLNARSSSNAKAATHRYVAKSAPQNEARNFEPICWIYPYTTVTY